MEYLKDIMTQFVRDRLGETNWENREYIKDLYKLERLIKKGGPTSYAESMLNKALQSEYPVEYACIKAELGSGKLTPAHEYAALRQEWEQQRLTQTRAQMERRIEDEKRQLEMWIEAGGR